MVEAVRGRVNGDREDLAGAGRCYLAAGQEVPGHRLSQLIAILDLVVLPRLSIASDREVCGIDLVNARDVDG